MSWGTSAGLYPAEQRVCALWDGGERDRARIAQIAGVSRQSVDSIVTRLCIDVAAQDRRTEEAAKLGSQALLRALRREGFA